MHGVCGIISSVGLLACLVACYINQEYDVNGACESFPRRVQMVVDAEGDRINK